jgi:hypothetical protein
LHPSLFVSQYRSLHPSLFLIAVCWQKRALHRRLAVVVKTQDSRTSPGRSLDPVCNTDS